ncbi:CgeB family protein [Plastoroseomonas arctica]|uniref:Glycosyltransferase n=1 Tax=Plastoroseomonas arctica TaxID=1509237 RepID=A0AAF1JWD2_9PROT|nr:glycosyltransferase [Plastoroseomonas arctica]MBR0654171.1 glycosyltransferase [Plastoroseomonas arctica]
MRIVVLGLSLSSSWGNGHATTYRALLRAFAARGHDILFLERQVPWYAAHRDLAEPGYCRLAFYDSVAELDAWHDALATADAVILGSYVPDGIAVGDYVQRVARLAAFYDIDTPVTLAGLARGEESYIAARQIAGFRLYLSFTGGPTLVRLEREYGSPAARQLYCSVDVDAYRPLDLPHRWDLSYLGTYSDDRQPTLERLLLDPARRAPERRFVVAGPQYPDTIDWPANVERIAHLPPEQHAAFYAQSRFTLNVTRADMILAGYSPSVRLFEAGACATPIISDEWPGLNALLQPGREILIADGEDEVVEALAIAEPRRRAMATTLRTRILAEHSSARRAAELEDYLLGAA